MMGGMISVEWAQRLAAAGVTWRPLPGDRFTLREGELCGDVFTVADMVVEARHLPLGVELAFNGTTEWALDSVRLADALWLPREDQLRDLLGAAFRGLLPTSEGFEVVIALPGRPDDAHRASRPADAYARAVLALVEAARA